MSNTGRIPLWLIGLVGVLAVLSLFISMVHTRFRIIIIIIIFNIHKVTLMDIKLKNRWTLNNIT
jgi:hypothetical protein